MDFSNLTPNNIAFIYFVVAVVVLLGGWLLQHLIPGIAGKVLAFLMFFIFMAGANWLIQYNFAPPPEKPQEQQSSSPPEDHESSAVSAPDPDKPVPASGSQDD